VWQALRGLLHWSDATAPIIPSLRDHEA
jgi:hypothetical protein